MTDALVSELERRRDKLMRVISDAPEARKKISRDVKEAKLTVKSLNVTIALLGGNAPSTNGHTTRSNRNEVWCGKCNYGPYRGIQGLAVHNHRNHGGKYKVMANG